MIVGPDQTGAIVDDHTTVDLFVDLDLEGNRDTAPDAKGTGPFDPVVGIVIGHGWRGRRGRAGHIGGACRNRVDHGDAGRRAGATIGDDNRIFNDAARGDNRHVSALLDIEDWLPWAIDLDKSGGIQHRRTCLGQQLGPVADHAVTGNVARNGHLEFDGDATARRDVARPLNPV